uniref:Uncharacterized protein n=1 Tax=Arundo donax TaxID=35708 RepID=A0A0A8XUX7_ARUDO
MRKSLYTKKKASLLLLETDSLVSKWIWHVKDILCLIIITTKRYPVIVSMVTDQAVQSICHCLHSCTDL